MYIYEELGPPHVTKDIEIRFMHIRDLTKKKTDGRGEKGDPKKLGEAPGLLVGIALRGTVKGKLYDQFMLQDERTRTVNLKTAWKR